MKDVSSPATGSRLLLLLPIFMLVAALTLNVVSLSMPRWISYQVNFATAGSATSLDFYNRTRGVFLTCLSDKLPSLSIYSDNPCVDMDFGNLAGDKAGYIGWSTASMILILRRLHLALHLASGFFLCLALLACFITCGCFGARRAPVGMIVTAGLALMAAGFQFGAQVIFMNGLLREILPPGEGTTAANKTNIFNAWSAALQQATQMSLDASYYIALASFGACLASGTMSMSCGASMALRRQNSQPPDSANPSDFAPSGNAAKTNGDATQLETFSNLSVTRLPRVQVNTNLGYTPY